MFTRNVRVRFKRRSLPVRVLRLFVFSLAALFWAAAVTCFLQAVNRVARAQELAARATVLGAVGDGVTDEERRTMIESVRGGALKRL